MIDKVTYRADGGGYLKPGFDHLFVVAATGGAPRQLTYGAFHDNGPLSWTPDGGSILFSANRSKDWERDARDAEVYQVEIASGGLRALTSRDGPDALPTISPDGRWIAYVGANESDKAFPQSHLYVMNRDGSGSRRLAAGLDRSIDYLEWSGGSIIIQYEDEGRMALARAVSTGDHAAEQCACRERPRPALWAGNSVRATAASR